MTSRIEQLIDEIEEYIDSCKPKAFSNNTQIIVNKDEIDELLRELRQKCPEEIKRYQKIIANKEAILQDAKDKAQNLIDKATEQTSQLINEHEIMQQAYAQANEVVTLATKQAQEILDKGTMEANEVRAAAIQYMDEMLGNLEKVLGHALENETRRHDEYIQDLSSYYDIVKNNRTSLHPSDDVSADPIEDAEGSENLDVM